MNLSHLSTPALLALYRIAKHPTKGARPFFTDARAMIELRAEVERRKEQDI